MLKTQRIPSFYGIFVVVALLPQILNFNGSTFDDIYKIFIIALFAAVLFYTAKIKLRKPLTALYLLLTLVSKLCTSISSGYSLARGMFDYVLLVVLFTLLFVFPQEIYLDSRKSIFDFYYVYAMFMLFACVYNMIKHFNSLIHILSITIYNTVRICSFFDNENTFGVYLLFGVIAALAMRVYSKKKRWTALVLVFMVNEYMAMCRTAMVISLAIVIIVLVFTEYRKYRLFIFLTTAVIVVIAVLAYGIFRQVSPDSDIFATVIDNAFSNTDSLEVRSEYVRNMLPLIRGRAALFGYGDAKAATYALAYTGNQYYHNTYLKILMTGGIFKLLLQLVLIIIAVKNSVSVFKNSKVDGLICFISVITYLIYATVEAVILLDRFVISIVAAIFVLTLPHLFNNFHKLEYIE